jgi:archaeal cell division control protein 6
MFDIDNFFQEFMNSERIFKDRSVLSPEYIPSLLPHRDLQMQKIAEIVACTLKNSIPSNMLIFGKTGTGKTAVVKSVSEHLNRQCKQANIPESNWIFLNCQQVNTGYRILAKICEHLDPEHPIPIAGWPIDVVFDQLINKINTFVEGICFIVLDEIDVIVKKSGSSHDILYNLVRINSRLKKARINIIGISNVLNFKNFLDPRVLSSLREEEIIFPAYNAMELKDILDQRSKMAFHPDTLDEDVIPLCAAFAAKEHGDARKSLDLLRKAGELAERRNIRRVPGQLVYLAQDDIEKDKMKEYCDSLPLQLKTVLLSIYLLQSKNQDKEIITGDVYNCYLEVQALIPSLHKLTQRRVSELIRELDLSGIINARVVSRGRMGRSKYIKLNIPIDDLKSYLETENNFNDLIDYQPHCIYNKKKIAMVNGIKYKKFLLH